MKMTLRIRLVLVVSILLIGQQLASAQADTVLNQIFRVIYIGCDFHKEDSVKEVAFSINLHVDIIAGNVDSFTIVGNLPANCPFSRPDYIARENRFLIKYLSDKKIDWKAWLASYGYAGCKKVMLICPQIIGTYDIKGDLGTTFYKDFIEPFYETKEANGPCTIIFKPTVGRQLYTTF